MPLKESLQNYIDVSNASKSSEKSAQKNTAWLKVGIAQRDVPAHIAHRYCAGDFAFFPALQEIIHEFPLSRELRFFNWQKSKKDVWFPLDMSNSSGLGVEFALSKGRFCEVSSRPPSSSEVVEMDLVAITTLERGRTKQLQNSSL